MCFIFFLGRGIPRYTLSSSSAASDVYKRQIYIYIYIYIYVCGVFLGGVDWVGISLLSSDAFTRSVVASPASAPAVGFSAVAEPTAVAVQCSAWL